MYYTLIIIFKFTIRYAKDAGISLTVADCEEELLKIEKIHSTARLIQPICVGSFFYI